VALNPLRKVSQAVSRVLSKDQAATATSLGQLVYAVGDIHGCYDLMTGLLAQIVTDADRASNRRPIVIFCGDYVDRGPDSAKVVEALVWLQKRTDLEVRLLKGNHEQALLDFLERPEKAGPWIAYGGAATLSSYGVEPPSADADEPGYIQARDQLLEKMPSSHLRLLQHLELMLSVGDYAFVHAGVRPGTALDKQTEADLLWIRADFIDREHAFEKIIVHGHTWAGDWPDIQPHRVGIDTGAYATDVLTAVRLEDGEMEILQERGPAAASQPSGATPALS
jgi:serine/threonine protein phosphatase 1